MEVDPWSEEKVVVQGVHTGSGITGHCWSDRGPVGGESGRFAH